MLYAIGDIHGQITMLDALLEQIHAEGFDHDRDTLLFLGDYIDRGENSCAVVDRLLKVRCDYPDTIFLRGNHEQMLLDARDSGPPKLASTGASVIFNDITLLWFQNGGIEALSSYGSIENPLEWWSLIPDTHWDFYQATRMEYITPHYHFVHAGLLPPGKSWEGQAYGLDPRLWIREPFLSSRHHFDNRFVVFGHTPQLRGLPLLQRNKIGLDTGAVFGGRLTAAAFDLDTPFHRFPNPPLFQIHNPEN